MKNTLVFYAGMLYGEYPFNGWKPFKGLRELPDGAYIRLPTDDYWGTEHMWHLSDFTPVLDSDVPKELLVLCLLLT